MATITENKLSSRVTSMAESATLLMSKLARELSAEGHDVISLSLGEPDFDTPDHIKAFAKKALDEGYTKYTPVPGLPELRKAIITKFKRDNNLDYALDEIVVSNGAKQSIFNICMALLDPGDEVAVLTPFWVSYSAIIELAGGTPVYVSAGIDDDFKVTAAQLKAAISDKTKFVIFSSPCNPTGSVYNKEELLELSKVILEFPNLLVVSDEIYEFINFTDAHASIGAMPGMLERAITVNGFAKGFAMTGWRLGYMGAPAWVAAACTKIQGQVTSGANAFSQKAGADALLADLTPTHKMKEAFANRRELLIGLLNEIPDFKVNYPKGAFYIFPDISAYIGKEFNNGQHFKNDEEFALYILRDAHVAVVAGSAFGAPGCIRISYAASEETLTEAVRRIKDCLSKLV